MSLNSVFFTPLAPSALPPLLLVSCESKLIHGRKREHIYIEVCMKDGTSIGKSRNTFNKFASFIENIAYITNLLSMTQYILQRDHSTEIKYRTCSYLCLLTYVQTLF